jgi:hypothetical protein
MMNITVKFTADINRHIVLATDCKGLNSVTILDQMRFKVASTYPKSHPVFNELDVMWYHDRNNNESCEMEFTLEDKS